MPSELSVLTLTAASLGFLHTAATIDTMLTLVLAAAYGGRAVPLGKLERYNHALAGAAIFLCGVSIQGLGL